MRRAEDADAFRADAAFVRRQPPDDAPDAGSAADARAAGRAGTRDGSAYAKMYAAPLSLTAMYVIYAFTCSQLSNSAAACCSRREERCHDFAPRARLMRVSAAPRAEARMRENMRRVRSCAVR